ncbi:peptidylprolyl isomerase [Corallococcus exercitus]|uniref:peptidylprolyl isomerase n=1 Tax=Corallococcus exercitus TaxID=2316736 RepID=A0A7Y4KHW0_9BACT|nr:peptidyl-prolyl cis-trans isomerase [Corallococcus exercitus]NOK34093.1 peptidylprolyl isomerase [Corallococcus exercitus]
MTFNGVGTPSASRGRLTVEISMGWKFGWMGVAVLGLSLGVGGCGKEKSASTPTETGPVVARVGETKITQAELEAKLAEQPSFVRARYGTPEKKKEFLDNLVRFELLVQEARRRGLESNPEVRAMLEKVMVQQLVKSQTESAEAVVSDADAKAFYDANLAEFVKPERVRISQLVLKAPRGTPERQKAMTQALKLAADVRKDGDVSRAFDAAVRAHSQDAATQAQGGDLGFHTREELTALGGEALAEAAWNLKAVGQLSAPIESDTGVHLLMLQARQVGHEQTFEQAKPRITQRLGAERRAKALEALVEKLRTQTPVEVNEEVLAKVNPEAGVKPAPGAGQAEATPR